MESSSLQYVSFDLSLARGLTYYTGLIYECVVVDGGVRVRKLEQADDLVLGCYACHLFFPIKGLLCKV